MSQVAITLTSAANITSIVILICCILACRLIVTNLPMLLNVPPFICWRLHENWPIEWLEPRHKSALLAEGCIITGYLERGCTATQ